jgi:basic amino acid/polyamine antiporter, APA family
VTAGARGVAGVDAELVRAIGVRRLTASIINSTIGAGIFVLPAVAAAGLGAAAPLAYLVCAGLMSLIVLCFASAGSRVSLTGGLYAYVEVAFGPFVGFLSGVLYALMATFAVASVATAFAGSLGVMWSAAAAGAARAVVLVALFGATAWVNVRGVSVGARLVEAVTVAKLVPLLVFVAAGIWYVRGDYLAWHGLPPAADVGRTAIILVFAFVGVEVALMPSGEVRAPAATVPRALFAALAITTTLYLLIQGVAQGLLGSAMSTYSAAPLAEASSRVLGGFGRVLVLAGATVSMFGYVSGDMLGSPRALFALGRDGAFPAALARVHPRFHTPHVAILTYAAIVAALAISSSFTQLAILANVAALTLYLMCVAASYQLQRSARGPHGTGAPREVKDAGLGGPPFDLPGGPLIPLLAAAAIVWLLAQATARELAIEVIVLGIASAFYVTVGRRPSRRRSSS